MKSAATREAWVIPSPSILILLSETGVVCRLIGATMKLESWSLWHDSNLIHS